jgi:hypothetical protein
MTIDHTLLAAFGGINRNNIPMRSRTAERLKYFIRQQIPDGTMHILYPGADCGIAIRQYVEPSVPLAESSVCQIPFAAHQFVDK